MKLINQSYEILNVPENLLKTLELAGRTCYKSEEKITENSAEKFIEMLIDRGHLAMIEFGFIIVKFITNRGVTHELVRHRLCSFAQESTRYVNYGNKEMEFIRPVWLDLEKNEEGEIPYISWLFLQACEDMESKYNIMLKNGWRPEQAREVLPNALKTEIVVGANIREWRHIFSLRCSKKAHPQMRALMLPLLLELSEKLPVVFDDLIPLDAYIDAKGFKKND